MSPYTTHADTIESAIVHACRAHRLAPDVADEFASWTRVRLLDNDQAILRKFAHRSSLRTFLITVVQRLFLDWRNAEWGKWRPTADARRLGPVAIELERLVIRDRLTFDEAVHTLVARRLGTPEECEQAWMQLPRRPRRTRAAEADLAALPAMSSASDLVDDDEARAEATMMCDALARALGALPPEDRTLVQLRYWSGQTVARIAMLTGEDQKGLYRRFDRLAGALRAHLEAEGLSKQSLAQLAGRFEAAAEVEPPPESMTAGNGQLRPSTMASTGGEHA